MYIQGDDMEEGYLTKIFKSGNSMAVRIPKSIDIKGYSEVFIYQNKEEIIIKPKKHKKTRWDLLFDKLNNIKGDEIKIEKMSSFEREKYFE